ncbi:MAG: hypothetical protein ACTHJT_12605 [Cytophaga sp.]|uniref:hypothetical protein n=1 Tax=Cytophaga sp. TaxID=29535 RepID=UPI003F7DB91B
MILKISKEETIAHEIWNILYKNFKELIEDKAFLNTLNFEIINDFHNKNVFFSYVLKEDTSIQKVEIALMTIGIYKEFIDNSNPGKRYLAVWM